MKIDNAKDIPPVDCLSPDEQKLIKEMRSFEPTAAQPFPSVGRMFHRPECDLAAVIAGTKPATLIRANLEFPGLLEEARRQNHHVVSIVFIDHEIDLAMDFYLVGRRENVEELAEIFRAREQRKANGLKPNLPHKRVGELLGYGQYANDLGVVRPDLPGTLCRPQQSFAAGSQAQVVRL